MCVYVVISVVFRVVQDTTRHQARGISIARSNVARAVYRARQGRSALCRASLILREKQEYRHHHCHHHHHHIYHSSCVSSQCAWLRRVVDQAFFRYGGIRALCALHQAEAHEGTIDATKLAFALITLSEKRTSSLPHDRAQSPQRLIGLDWIGRSLDR